MARSILNIQQELIAEVQANAILAPLLTSTSKTSIWRLFTYVVAVSIFALENLFDLFTADVNEIIAAKNPHTLRWYAEKSKAFQYGYNLPADTDLYDNTGIAESVIDTSKIIAHAAVVEQERGLRIKVAKSSGANLEALETTELNAFKDYLAKVKDAGVKLNITSTAADKLKLSYRIKYNALVLNASGGRIDGTVATPVKDAIKQHLKNLPFNGIFSVTGLVDDIQKVEGVQDVKIDVVQTKYGALPFSSVDIDYIPDSGYLIIEDADLTETYIPY